MSPSHSSLLGLSNFDIFIIGGVIFTIFVLYVLRKKIIWELFAFDKRGEKILSEKKSSEVRVGQIVEAISPFLDGFPVDHKKKGATLAYIGRPIDFIYFDPEKGVTFVEVKSGESKLSPDQKKLKDLIKSGKVSWAEFRVKGDGKK